MTNYEPQPDTPTKKAATGRMDHHRISAADWNDSVADDIGEMVLVADTNELLQTILPLESMNVDTVFEALKAKNVYDAGAQRWTQFPEKPAIEKDLYIPFAKTATEIVNVCNGNGFTKVDTHWPLNADQALVSQDKTVPPIRPDLVAALGGPTSMHCAEKIAELTSKIKNMENEAEKIKAVRCVLVLLRVGTDSDWTFDCSGSAPRAQDIHGYLVEACNRPVRVKAKIEPGKFDERASPALRLHPYGSERAARSPVRSRTSLLRGLYVGVVVR